MNEKEINAIREKTRLLCENDPFKAMLVFELISEYLNFMTLREFAEICIYSERKIYDMVSDSENAMIEFVQICNTKFIPKNLNLNIISNGKTN